MKVYLRTFGCRANQYDSEAVRELIVAGGHTVVDSAADADAAVFNSCAVTADAEADLRQAVRRAVRERPGLTSIVMGCAAALRDERRAASARLRALPGVEAVIAGADLPAIAAALSLAPPPEGVRTRIQTGARALLRVQDGCDEHCTFCATTLARGRNRSRTPDALVREAESLAAHHAEIVITGIHIGAYGVDIDSSLGQLMTRLVADVPRVRFRLSSIEATEIDDRLVEVLAGAPERLAPHVHAPLQSGSDRVLHRMGRHWYSADTYARAIDRLASRMSVLGLGADVIAGFPGETNEDHLATCALVERLPFSYVHVFPFSSRPDTAAERLRDHLPHATVAARARALRALAERKAAAFRTARAGGQADVVVVHGGVAGNDERRGLTGDYLDVAVPDPTHTRGDRFTGTLSQDPAGQLVAC